MGLFSKLRRPKEKTHGASQGSRGVSSSATSTADPISTSITAVSTSGLSRSPPSTIVTVQSPPEQVVLSALQPLGSTAASPAADSTSLAPSQDVNPWTRAYEIFQIREPELMEDYKKHLTSLQDGHIDSVDLSTPRSVEAIVAQLLEDREKKQWRVSLLGKDIKIREQAERLTKFLLWSDPLVKNALSAQPYAALAWSGVSLLLPLLTSGNTQNEAMLKGFNSIGDVQVYWDTCEKTYLRSSHRQVYQDIIEPLAELYSYVIEYQTRVICHLSKSQLSRAWQNVAGWDHWARKVSDIDGRSKLCSERIPHQREEEVRERWNRQLQEMQQSRTILNKIHWILEEGGKQNQQNYEDQKERDLLQDLASDHEGYKNFNPQRVPGTCEWFFSDNRFRKWQESNDSSLLWVSAGPGCGKSVLSRALIDEHRLSMNITTSTVCHFFFKDGDKRRMHSANALSAILHQIFTQDPSGSLIRNALPSHKNYGNALAQNFSELWRILVECARSSDAGEIICILDALDECNRDGRRQLIDHLKDHYFKQDERSRSPSKLKFLITSRPYDDLEASFRKFSNKTAYLRFAGDDKSEQIGQEISLVIDARVEELTSGFADEDRRMISERLKSMEHRTYLWLHLTFDIIEQSPSDYGRRSDVEDLLSELPSQVSEAYEKILKRSTKQTQTEILLQIVLAATRPLALDEVNIALTLALQKQRSVSNAELDSLLWPRHNFASVVKNLCGLFINIYDSKLSFIHQTAREFLTSSERQGIWKGRLNISKSHSTISRSCLDYLLLLPDIDMTVKDKPAEEEQFPFLPYAAAYWPLHYISQETAVASRSRKDARILCNIARYQVGIWAPIYFEQRYLRWRGWTDLELASDLGLEPVVEDILYIEKADVNAQNEGGYFGTALQAASAKGHQAIVQMLLDKGADVNAYNKDGYYSTALHAASEEGHQAVVQMLLDKGADINTQDGHHNTALYAASVGGHQAVVQMLLDKGADINVKCIYSDTALQVASAKGYQAIVRILLDKGADINSQSGNYGTALQAASAKGHQTIVQMLLDKGANVNTQGGHYDTALYAASAKGYQAIVQILLDKGADINAQGRHYNTALEAASVEGHQAVVQILLDKGADINAQGRHYNTALEAASVEGHQAVVQMLLDKYADINSQSGNYGTALQAASAKGHQIIVQMLLDKGADINTQGGHYDTALYAASAEGYQAIVQMLLDKGANVNNQVRYYSIALEAASAGGYQAIVQMLLDKGADVNAYNKDGYYSTALHAASEEGHQAVVQMLLDKGANVNTQGGHYITALYAASVEGHQAVVQMLLDKGADMNAYNEDGYYSSALEAASTGGHQTIVQILLDKGADVNAYDQDGYYCTALQAASAKGHQAIVQMLLDKGANVNNEEENYNSALYTASAGGYQAIAQMLLDKGAKVNNEEGNYRSALHAASRGGHQAVVQMLLDKGAKVNNEEGNYRSALHAASEGGHQAVVQMLLDKGANINDED